MQKLKGQSQRERMIARGITALFCFALFMSAAAGLSYAQAGRRVQKPKNDPPVPKAAGAAAAAAPVKEPTPEPEKISLLVAGSRSGSMRYTLGLTDNLPGVVGRRLQDSKRVLVASGGEMSRGEANKRAKNDETKTFIVLVELQGNGFDLDPINRRTRLEDLAINYVVLEPGTGKVKDQGNVRLRSTSGGILGGLRRLPSCYPQANSNLEFALTVAGIETAERILRAFSLSLPPLCS